MRQYLIFLLLIPFSAFAQDIDVLVWEQQTVMGNLRLMGQEIIRSDGNIAPTLSCSRLELIDFDGQKETIWDKNDSLFSIPGSFRQRDCILRKNECSLLFHTLEGTRLIWFVKTAKGDWIVNSFHFVRSGFPSPTWGPIELIGFNIVSVEYANAKKSICVLSRHGELNTYTYEKTITAHDDAPKPLIEIRPGEFTYPKKSRFKE